MGNEAGRPGPAGDGDGARAGRFGELGQRRLVAIAGFVIVLVVAAIALVSRESGPEILCETTGIAISAPPAPTELEAFEAYLDTVERSPRIAFVPEMADGSVGVDDFEQDGDVFSASFDGDRDLTLTAAPRTGGWTMARATLCQPA
jgi:hypothetical protein